MCIKIVLVRVFWNICWCFITITKVIIKSASGSNLTNINQLLYKCSRPYHSNEQLNSPPSLPFMKTIPL
jgi:hypothetical protein